MEVMIKFNVPQFFSYWDGKFAISKDGQSVAIVRNGYFRILPVSEVEFDPNEIEEITRDEFNRAVLGLCIDQNF